MEEIVQKNVIFDDKFRTEYIDHWAMMKNVRKIDRKEEFELTHGEDAGMVFKYDLPVVNEAIKFKNELILIDGDDAEISQVEKLFEILDCDKDTAYESFMIKLSQEYNHEVDMYGDIVKAGDVDLRVLDFGIPIPTTYLSDEY